MDPEAGDAEVASPGWARRDGLAEAEKREAALRRQLDRALSNVDVAAAELERLSEELAGTRSQFAAVKALEAERIAAVEASAAELRVVSEDLSRTRSELEAVKELQAEEAGRARAEIEAMRALDAEQAAKTRARVESMEALKHENRELRGLVDAYRAKIDRVYGAWQMKCTELAKLKNA